MVVTVQGVIRPIEEHIGAPYMMWPDGGFVSGGIDDEVRGLLCAWMATTEALEKAVAEDCNVVICHECVYFTEKVESPPYRWLTPDPGGPNSGASPNARRRKLIDESGLTVMQMHYGLDRYCFYGAFARAMRLTRAVAGHGWETVYELDEPLTLLGLAGRAKELAGIEGTVRVVGDPGRQIRRVGNLWGGVGLNGNLYWHRRLIENGAEVCVCGEIDEFACHHALESGLCLIETSHTLSESMGMRAFADDVRSRFPRLKVVSHDMGRPYATV